MNRLESVADLYSKFWKRHTEAIIAGGFPRDFHLGREWKDVDIYTNATTSQLYSTLRKLLPEDSFTPKLVFADKYKLGSHVNYVAQVKYPETLVMFDFISVDMNPYTYIRNYFDFNLCKIVMGYSVTGGFMNMTVTEDAQRDIDNETLTMSIKPDWNKMSVGKALMEHYPRIHAKYPDYELVVEVE